MNFNCIHMSLLPNLIDVVSENINEVKQACRLILNTLSMKGTTKAFWDIFKKRDNVNSDTAGANHAFLSAKMMSLKHVVFTRIFL